MRSVQGRRRFGREMDTDDDKRAAEVFHGGAGIDLFRMLKLVRRGYGVI